MTVMDERIAARRRSVREATARRRLKWTLWLLVAALLVGGVAWLLQSPVLSVERIAVSGVARSTVDDRLGASGVAVGRPLISINADAVEEDLEADPWVAVAAVRVVWPDTVEVEVLEHVPAAWLRATDSWFLVAASGAVLESAPLADAPPDTTLPVVEIALAAAVGTSLDDPAALGAIEFLHTLGDPDAVVTGRPQGIFATVAGHEVRLGGPTDMADKAVALTALLDQGLTEGAAIDLLSPWRPAVIEPVG